MPMCIKFGDPLNVVPYRWVWVQRVLFLLAAVASRIDAAPSANRAQFISCIKSNSVLNKNSFQHIPSTDKLYLDYVKRTFNTRFHYRKPAYIALPKSAADIANLLKCAEKHGMRYVVRDGGHSYAGMSSIDQGVVIDMSKITAITINSKAKTATIGGGQRLGEVYLKLWQSGGFAFPGGNCVAVGVSGLTLGGGVGPNTRKLGLAIDSLLSAQVVLANGSIVTASEGVHPDLFFALRGGSGSFGVVTSWTFALHKAPPTVTVMEYAWPSSKLGEVFAAIAKWKPYTLPEAYSKVEWFYGFGSFSVSINYWGKQGDVEAMMRKTPLFQVGGGYVRYLKEHDYLSYMVKLTNLQNDAAWGVESMKVQNVITNEYGPNAPEAHRAYPFNAGSIMLDKDLSSAAVDGMRRAVEANGMGWVQAKALGGKVGSKLVGETAFPHRRAKWVLQAYTTVRSSSDIQWVKDTKAALAPHSTGLEYVNYIDCAVPPRKVWQIYFGPNGPRLLAIKKKYDPNNRFNALVCTK